MSHNDCVTGHSVAIFQRGGSKRVGAVVNLASVSWERIRSDRSQASFTVSARNCETQATLLDSIQPHAHEMVVYRGSDRVWEGPVMDAKWYPDRFEAVGEDAGAYIRNTVLTRAYPPDFQEFMTERAKQIIQYEMTTPYTADVGLNVAEPITIPRWENLGSDPWPYDQYGGPANVLPFLDVRDSLGVGGLRTFSDVVAFQMLLGEHLDNLAEGGLDYTTVGRRFVVWDSAVPLGRTRPVSDVDFAGEVVVISSGRDQASIQHVVAQAQEDPDTGETTDPQLGTAGGVDPFYGVWTDLRTREDEEADNSTYALNTQARRVLSGRRVSPLQIMAPSGLLLGATIKVPELVPGVVMPVRAVMNLKRVSQDQVLDRVTVDETADGETVNVELSPIGDVEPMVGVPGPGRDD